MHRSICPADGDDDDADDEGEDDSSAAIKFSYLSYSSVSLSYFVFPLSKNPVFTVTGPVSTKPGSSNQVHPGPRTGDEHDEQHRKHEAKIGDRFGPRRLSGDDRAVHDCPSEREIGRTGKGGSDSIYKAYFLGLCKGISPQNMAKHMVRYLHFRILKFPLKMGWNGITMDNNIIKLSAWMVYTKHVFYSVRPPR